MASVDPLVAPLPDAEGGPSPLEAAPAAAAAIHRGPLLEADREPEGTNTDDQGGSPGPVVTARSLDQTLTPVLGRRWALGLKHLVVVIGFCVLFMYLNYLPLFYTDLWCHVGYGDWILQHGRLPMEDPFMPLAAGMRVVDSAWLGQVVLALAHRWGGMEGLSAMFALSGVTIVALQFRAYWVRSGQLGLTMAATLAAFVIPVYRHAVIRPEMFGGVCFAVLLWLFARQDRRDEDESTATAKVPASVAPALAAKKGAHQTLAMILFTTALFALWANLHGSYVVGLAFLGCRFLGRLLDHLWAVRSWRAVLMEDRVVRSRLIQAEAAFFGSLVNPYGMDLLLNNLSFGKNPNLKNVTEWYPLNILSIEGGMVAASLGLTMLLLRFSRRRISGDTIVAVALFLLLTLKTVRFIGWYGPIFVYATLPHWQALATPWNSSRWMRLLHWRFTKRSFRTSLVTVLAIWVTFVFTPISSPAFQGKPRPEKNILLEDTPVAAAKYLRDNPIPGLVFTPQWWGDYLTYNAPGLQPTVTSNIHLVPQRVWMDCHGISRGGANFQRQMDKYGIEGVVTDKARQPGFSSLLRQSSQWRVVYEDRHATVFRRVSAPTPLDPETTAASADTLEDG